MSTFRYLGTSLGKVIGSDGAERHRNNETTSFSLRMVRSATLLSDQLCHELGFDFQQSRQEVCSIWDAKVSICVTMRSYSDIGLLQTTANLCSRTW